MLMKQIQKSHRVRWCLSIMVLLDAWTSLDIDNLGRKGKKKGQEEFSRIQYSH